MSGTAALREPLLPTAARTSCLLWQVTFYGNVFMACISFSLVMPSLWLYLRSLHAEEGFYAWVVAVYSVGEAVGSVTIGSFSNRIGTKVSLLLTAAISLVGALVALLPPLSLGALRLDSYAIQGGAMAALNVVMLWQTSLFVDVHTRRRAPLLQAKAEATERAEATAEATAEAGGAERAATTVYTSVLGVWGCVVFFFVHFNGFAVQETITTPLVERWFGLDATGANLLFVGAGGISLTCAVGLALASAPRHRATDNSATDHRDSGGGSHGAPDNGGSAAPYVEDRVLFACLLGCAAAGWAVMALPPSLPQFLTAFTHAGHGGLPDQPRRLPHHCGETAGRLAAGDVDGHHVRSGRRRQGGGSLLGGAGALLPGSARRVWLHLRTLLRGAADGGSDVVAPLVRAPRALQAALWPHVPLRGHRLAVAALGLAAYTTLPPRPGVSKAPVAAAFLLFLEVLTTYAEIWRPPPTMIYII